MPNSEYFMMVGMMALPTGIIIFLKYGKYEVIGLGLVVIALVAWLAGIYAMHSEEKKRRDDRKVTNALIQRLDASMTTLISEIKGVRQGLTSKGGGDSGSKDN